jgi:hypothetical protein
MLAPRRPRHSVFSKPRSPGKSKLVGILSNASNLTEQPFPAPGRILYWLMNLHFLLVGLACYLVRIAFKGLSFQVRCTHIALGVAAGDQNG